MGGGRECTLAETQAGAQVRIVRIDGGRQLQSRLIGMGIFRGVQVAVVRKDPWGPVVLRINRDRVVLGRGLLGRVIVAPVETHEARDEEDQGRAGRESEQR